MPRRGRWARLAASMFVALAVAGCGGDEEEGGDPLSQAREAQKTASFPLLWLGESYRGDEANEIDAGGGRGGMFYGTCEIPPEQTEGGCAPPYELQEQDACRGFPVAVGRPRLRSGPGRAVSWEEGGGTVVLTGETYVKLFGPSIPQAIEAARLLQPVGDPTGAETLPPPAECQGQPEPEKGEINLTVTICIPRGRVLDCSRQTTGPDQKPGIRPLPPWEVGERAPG